MSLLDEFMVECCFMKKVKTKDGSGGFCTSWEDGETFTAAIVRDTSVETVKAEQESVTATYTITTKKSVKLEKQDIIKRIEDGTYFRVTEIGGERKTPLSASIDMSQVSAERCKLP